MAESVLTRSANAQVRARGLLDGIHTYERIILVYFLYLFAFSLFRPIPAPRRVALFVVPVSIYALIQLEASVSRSWSKLLRQWASLGLILVAYWLLAWIVAAPLQNLESAWVAWDEHLLNSYGLKHAVEAAGWVGPSLIETCYLLVYAIPPLSLGVVYACQERARANQYLAILFLGTFTTYALLPFFPIVSPRLAFPASVPPEFHGIARRINTFLLDRYDISTGVFPSGHVAVVFSSALGLFSVIRGRSWIWGTALVIAFLVYVDTIYGRYHYAVDGLASICVVFLVWRASRAWRAKAD